MAVARKAKSEKQEPTPISVMDNEAFGEVVDQDTAQRLSLAFDTLEKFPDFVRRHRRFVGGATATAIISSTAIILAYRTIHGRLDKGESAIDALKGITEDEVERSISLLRRIRRRK